MSTSRREFCRALGVAAGSLAMTPLVGACDVREYARRKGAKLRLSIATAGTGGVYYVYGGGIAKVVSAHVPNVEVTAELTAVEWTTSSSCAGAPPTSPYRRPTS